ncbi:MAG: TIGR04211 family SH3 domain-containing protein [Desulfosalsimonadaceae bacterium]
MRACAVFLLIFLAGAAVAAADAKYVNDRLEVTLRSGPGLEYRILRSLPTGTELEMLEKRDKWSRVNLPGGAEGWVLSRYLTDELPDSEKYKNLKEKCAPLEKKLADLESANKSLKTENQRFSDKLAELRQQLSRTEEKYKKLRESASEYLTVKKENKRLSAQLEKKNQKIASLEDRAADAFLSDALKWFLCGAGVLVLGILIGSRNKRKRSSLV